MHVAIIGLGVVGSRAAQLMIQSDEVDVVTVVGHDADQSARVASALGARARPGSPSVGDLAADVDVVIVATPSGRAHRDAVAAALARGHHVVSTSDAPDDVTELMGLDALASERGRRVVAAAAVSPGLSDLLVAYAAGSMDSVTEVLVSMVGAAGPACQQRRRLARHHDGRAWRDGWQRERGGSGPMTLWFPAPVGAREVRAGALSEPISLRRVVPGAQRLTARSAPASRRLGALVAVRVEVRGRLQGASVIDVLGLVDRPGLAAGSVAGIAALMAARSEASGAGGVAELGEPGVVLARLAQCGVKVARFAPHPADAGS